MSEFRCPHLGHTPSGRCLGCNEQHEPMPGYKPGDDEVFLAEYYAEDEDE